MGPKAAPTTSTRSTRSARVTRSAAKPSTPEKAATKAVPKAKASPYFVKGGKGGGKARAKPPPADDMDESDEGLLEPSGLTETEDDSDSDPGSDLDSGPDSDSDNSDAFAPSDDDGEAPESSQSDPDVDSDDLDTARPSRGRAGARKEIPTTKALVIGAKRKAPTPGVAKGRKKVRRASSDDDYDDESSDGVEEIELEEGQEIAGRIHPAPKKGWASPGQISQNTLDFLHALMHPENNDRDWLRSHDPWFRQCEKEWLDFVGLVQAKFAEADDQVPVLPPKDVFHRIYRDVRFSSDKSPYKTHFSFTTSRGGRKGPWAKYNVALCPLGNSYIACGVWQPDKDRLARIRAGIMTDPQPFRDAIGAPAFVEMFGPATPHPKGKRQNVFGFSDMLKVAPKGVDKTHKDIDLLKLRSIIVTRNLSDEEMLRPDIMDLVGDTIAVMAPFVHMCNGYILDDADDDDDGA